MVFNWFRRQFSNPSQDEVEQQLPAPEQPEEEAPESEPIEESAEVASDYLNWAKAAYQNIQQRQQASTATPSEAVHETVADADVAPVSPTQEVTQPVTEVTENLIIETATTTAAVTQVAPVETPAEVNAAALSSTEEATVAHTAEDIPETDTLSEPIPPASLATEDTSVEQLPVWARSSNAERQSRLERLMATAIEEPEPVAATMPSVEQPLTELSVETDLVFDEGFLWSAEVLASQGRRPEDVSIEEISWLKRLRQGLDKTRRSLINQLKAIVGQGPLNQDAVMQIEALLLQADVGVEATDYIINTLQDKLRSEVLPPEQAIAYLKQILREMLDQPYSKSYNPIFAPEKDTLNIWLMTGVNGVGKTTTIGKMAHLAAKSGYRCLIAAADTFRAAAVEQVKIWGQRSGTEVIANPGKNTDPAAVVFDAIVAAQSRETELLLIDTAGRLQNKKNLMDELSKIRRIVDKKAPDARVESLLVLDATLGQNGLRQAEVFSEAAKLSGVVLTKLDGTAKGGVALAVVKQLGLPIRFIGAGEGIEDLRPFSSYEFVEALLSS